MASQGYDYEWFSISYGAYLSFCSAYGCVRRINVAGSMTWEEILFVDVPPHF